MLLEIKKALKGPPTHCTFPEGSDIGFCGFVYHVFSHAAPISGDYLVAATVTQVRTFTDVATVGKRQRLAFVSDRLSSLPVCHQCYIEPVKYHCYTVQKATQIRENFWTVGRPTLTVSTAARQNGRRQRYIAM